MIEPNIKLKIQEFITILLESKLELTQFDIYTTEKYKKKKNWYSFRVDTGIPVKASGFGFSFMNQNVSFSVCVDDGSILLEKDDYQTFKETDVDFANECAKLIEEKYRIKQVIIVDNIINTTNTELKLNRESNISKLKLDEK